MILLENEFNVLSHYTTNNTTHSDTETTQLLQQKGWLNTDNTLTEAGQTVLEPYKVKHAIIMAAGMSTRFAPLSYEYPKALVTVKGERMIERQIRQLQEAGIPQITIITGYLHEQLHYLQNKFNVQLIHNADYYRYNNTSSLMLVRHLLNNTYICSADNYFTENPFTPYVYRSYYAALYAEGPTNEYCLTFDQHDLITDVVIGGTDAWYMLGHVYVDHTFGQKFATILTDAFTTDEGKQALWEDVYIQHINELSLYIKKYDTTVIKEFDSLAELQQFDNAYLKDTQSKILTMIAQQLHCSQADIQQIIPIKTQTTTFQFEVAENIYSYQHPQGKLTLISTKD